MEEELSPRTPKTPLAEFIDEPSAPWAPKKRCFNASNVGCNQIPELLNSSFEYLSNFLKENGESSKNNRFIIG